MDDDSLTGPPRRLEIHDEPAAQRYELHDRSDPSNSLRSFAVYRLHGDTVIIPHVETRWEHRGNGFADDLLERVALQVRAEGRKIRPTCGFAAAFFRSRADLADVLA